MCVNVHIVLSNKRTIVFIKKASWLTRSIYSHQSSALDKFKIYKDPYTMKSVKYISSIIIAVALASTIGCASSSANDGKAGFKNETAGEYLDDSVTTTRVKTALINEPSLKSFEIKVVTYKGSVQLSGFVSSQASIEKAVSIASAIDGVKSVKNAMQLKAN
jgi:osmotically-inducible protein OsmY